MTNESAQATHYRAAMDHNSPSPEYRDKLTKKLFERLESMYGALFLDLWKSSDIMKVRQAWTEDLSIFTVGDIADAINRLKDSESKFPPTLPEFRALCRAAHSSAPTESQAAFKLPAPDTSAENAQKQKATFDNYRNIGKKPASRDWAQVAIAKHESGEHRLHIGELEIVRAAL